MDKTFSANEQRQTATLNYEISAIWEMMPRATPQTTSRERDRKQVMRPKALQVI